MEKYTIGIDTGGTYTDAVIMANSTGQIIHSAKVPTVHHDLSIGISLVLHRLLQEALISAEALADVAISSTLATNAVVENRGARVAVFVIGYVKHFKLPVKAVIFIKGGHNITGAEEEPLDLEYLVSLPETLKEEVDAYGICSAMSFKNPTHELVAERAVSMLDPKPIFLSHRISTQAGMEERAATAALHARLMPLMQEFMAGVDKALAAAKIACPVQIIGGNGQAFTADTAARRGGMTVASGPACTAVFGAFHSAGDALIIDVGGTTTDITMVRNGEPLLVKDGSRIGNWRTHVEAIDMVTRGIGGDSHVHIDEKNNLTIGPRRVSPLATSPFSGNVAEWLGRGDNSKIIALNDISITGKSGNKLVQTLAEKGACTPQTLKETCAVNGMPFTRELDHLARGQLIQETGFTPTDALHVLGQSELGERKKAEQAAAILGKCLGLSGEEFCRLVIEETVAKIESGLLEYLTSYYWDQALVNFVANRDKNPVLGVEFSLKIPLIGIGAAARFFLPEVARRLHTIVHFPENYQVGNAIGAALILAGSRKS